MEAYNLTVMADAKPKQQVQQQEEKTSNVSPPVSSQNSPSGDRRFNVQIPTVSLPKIGGAIKSIDEKFEINAVNGSANFSIPLPTGSARGFGASLSIAYNSGGGNGLFGMGWSLSIASIRRKTEKELPQYFDSIDSDTYIFSGAEDLVPKLKEETPGEWSVDAADSPDGLFKIKKYRPRIEGAFARIE